MPINSKKLNEITRLAREAILMAEYLESQKKYAEEMATAQWSRVDFGGLRFRNYNDYKKGDNPPDAKTMNPIPSIYGEFMDEFEQDELELAMEFVRTIHNLRRDRIERKLKELEGAIRDAGQSL